MTFETFDQADFWKIFRFLEDFQIFGRFSDFWKIFRYLEDFWKIFRFLEDFQIFGRFSEFSKIFRFLETTTATKTILGLVTLEILITILTIENLNS